MGVGVLLMIVLTWTAMAVPGLLFMTALGRAAHRGDEDVAGLRADRDVRIRPRA
jgi:hypothetical protein